MAEKLGNWYIIKPANIIYKIDKKYVNNNCIEVYRYDRNGGNPIKIRETININDIIKYYDSDNLLHCKNDLLYFGKRNIYIKILNETYENMLEIEKLREQVEKLTAHVQALMIKTESLPKDYDGEFP